MKWCLHCKTSRSESDFHKAKHTKDGLQGWCKECMKARRREDQTWYNRNSYAGQREWKLNNHFGITSAEYDQILASQGGVCPLCDKAPADKKFPVDHSHQTGAIRGIPCNACNLRLGRIEAGQVKGIPRELVYLGLL